MLCIDVHNILQKFDIHNGMACLKKNITSNNSTLNRISFSTTISFQKKKKRKENNDIIVKTLLTEYIPVI